MALRHRVLGAYDRQFLVEDAISGLDELSHPNAIERIFQRIGHVRRTGRMLAMMAPPTQP